MDTSPVVTITVYPDYTINGGVTLYDDAILSNGI